MTNEIGKDGLYINAPSRTFSQSIGVCFEKYFTFSGRASRSEYWFFTLFVSLTSLIATTFDIIFLDYNFDEGSVAPISTVLSLILFFPSMSVLWRRLHDTNKSGWWIGGAFLALMVYAIFIGVVASMASSKVALLYMTILMLGFIVYYIAILIFLCTKGDASQNRFG